MTINQSPHISSSVRLRLAFFLNFAFTLLEIVGGILTNSVAVLSGAVHDLGDTFSLGFAWYLDRYAEKERDRWYSYGYRRFSLLGALATAFGMTVGGVAVLSQAIPRLAHPEHPKAGGMVLLAVAGIVVNGVAAMRVKGGRTLNARLVMWHLLGDMLGWTSILLVSSVMLVAAVPVLDPILSILITVLVTYNVLRSLKKVVQLFLQSVPSNIDIGEIEKKLLEIEKVKSVHHTHVWSLDGEHNVLTTHLVVDHDATREDVAAIRTGVRNILKDSDLEHTTVEIGFEGDYCPFNEK